jgi:iron-sulfur cluster insertion protein
MFIETFPKHSIIWYKINMETPKITITDNAAVQIARLIALEDVSGVLRLRISVSGGGCSGFQYHFTLDNAQTPDDQIFLKNDTAVIIDEISLSLLSESVVDYVEDLTSAQFVIKNPNATASCGCGNSFSI